MANDKQTLTAAVDELCRNHKNDPNCFSRHDLRDLDVLVRGTNWLWGEAHRGPLSEERHGQAIRRTHALRKKLKKKWDDHQHEQKRWQELLLMQEEAKDSAGQGGRTTAHYIWRTQQDGNVRPGHAANEGKIFAWENPPPTGHPGEAFGCRCWAEPYEAEDGELQERSSQVVTFAAPDAMPAWTREDFFHHYDHGKGKMVRLSGIGHLQNIINHARTYDQGGGSIFKRVENEIFEKSRQSGEGSFPYDFNNSYEFEPVIFEIGGATVAGEGSVNVVDKGEFWMITADLGYAFSDEFTRPYDYIDIGIWPFTIETGTPYPITGEWSTRLEAIIKK